MDSEHGDLLRKITIFAFVYYTIFRFGIDGKACILRLICELAETNGLPYNGLLGKALETLFL